jgi:hypothetical protein
LRVTDIIAYITLAELVIRYSVLVINWLIKEHQKFNSIYENTKAASKSKE